MPHLIADPGRWPMLSAHTHTHTFALSRLCRWMSNAVLRTKTSSKIFLHIFVRFLLRSVKSDTKSGKISMRNGLSLHRLLLCVADHGCSSLTTYKCTRAHNNSATSAVVNGDAGRRAVNRLRRRKKKKICKNMNYVSGSRPPQVAAHTCENIKW